MFSHIISFISEMYESSEQLEAKLYSRKKITFMILDFFFTISYIFEYFLRSSQTNSYQWSTLIKNIWFSRNLNCQKPIWGNFYWDLFALKMCVSRQKSTFWRRNIIGHPSEFNEIYIPNVVHVPLWFCCTTYHM